MICIAVTYVIKPNCEQEAIELFGKLSTATRAEPGCRMYVAHRSITEPRKFFLYEQYDDQSAMDFHRASPHFAEHAIGGLFKIVESRVPELYEPLAD